MSDRITLGSAVRVSHQADRDRSYVEHARLARQLCDGLKGVTIAEHDSHGLCYAVKCTSNEVKFSSALVVYYDREELEVIS